MRSTSPPSAARAVPLQDGARNLARQRRERVPADLQAVNDALGFLIVGDGDGNIDVLGEPGLRAERHCQSANYGPSSAKRIEVRVLPVGRHPEAIARLATRPAEPGLHSGLDLLIRGRRILTQHALPVDPNPGLAHVEDDPELLNVNSGHEVIHGGIEQSGLSGHAARLCGW